MRTALRGAAGALLLAASAASAAPLTPPIASYRIRCRLDDSSKTVEGTELVTWRNTTSHPASSLRFHLYLNAFRNTRTTFFRESGGESRSNRFRAGGWGSISVARVTDAAGADLTSDLRYLSPDDDNPDDRTVAEIPLAAPVAPGEVIRLSMDFVSKLPRIYARSGWKGDFFFVAQWFPKIAVLEEEGWNCHQYHANSEFFADFGDYDVAIDVPSRFKGKVGATGRLIEESDAPGGRVIEHFRQESVHDFAWTADPGYEVHADRFSAPGGPSVALTLLLQPEHHSVRERYFRAVKTALAAFGERYGSYPYDVLTIVDPPWGAGGAGGMEYPTLISCGTGLFHPAGLFSPEGVTIHEFGHQYFYGLLASNEFEEPWLDEGFTTYATTRVMGEAYGDSHPAFWLFGFPIVFRSIAIHPPLDGQLRYFDTATRDPLTASWKFEDGRNYRMVYNKTALALSTVERIVGTKRFDAAMAEYAREFRFRHPKTDDFVEVLSRTTGTDWSDFIRRALLSSSSLDYAVEKATSVRSKGPRGLVETGGRVSEVDSGETRKGWDSEAIVERRGDLSLPVDVQLRFEGGKTYTSTWDGKARWKRFRMENGPRLLEARVDPDEKLLLDTDRTNNGRRTRPDAAAANLWTARAFFWTENLVDLFMELW